MVKLVKPLQPSKADQPIIVTLEGMVKLVKPLQPEKADRSIEVTLEGITKLVKPLQPSKADQPILVTLEGMDTRHPPHRAGGGQSALRALHGRTGNQSPLRMAEAAHRTGAPAEP